jgi:ABC-type microcin C transport system permease subunit YejE
MTSGQHRANTPLARCAKGDEPYSCTCPCPLEPMKENMGKDTNMGDVLALILAGTTSLRVPIAPAIPASAFGIGLSGYLNLASRF